MHFSRELLQNKVLIIAFLAWFVAQFLKVLITLVMEKRIDLKQNMR